MAGKRGALTSVFIFFLPPLIAFALGWTDGKLDSHDWMNIGAAFGISAGMTARSVGSGESNVRSVDFGAEEQPEAVPLSPEEQIAGWRARAEMAEAHVGRLMELLSNREWLTARVIKLLNSERRSLYLVAIGAAGALLLTGGGFGIKAVYDAAHRPAAETGTRETTRLVPVYIPGQASSPSLAPSPSLVPSPSPGSQPVAAVQPQPSPSRSTLPLPPLPSPSLPVKSKHCPSPPETDLPPRCLPPLPSPSLPPLHS